jgi:hypothetical protein
MGGGNLVGLYFDDGSHLERGSSFFHTLYFFLHAPGLLSNLPFYSSLQKVQKNLPVIHERGHEQEWSFHIREILERSLRGLGLFLGKNGWFGEWILVRPFGPEKWGGERKRVAATFEQDER